MDDRLTVGSVFLPMIVVLELEMVGEIGVFGPIVEAIGKGGELFKVEALGLAETHCAIQHIAGFVVKTGEEFLGGSLRGDTPFDGRRNCEREEGNYDQ